MMKSLKRTWPVAAILLLMMILAACTPEPGANYGGEEGQAATPPPAEETTGGDYYVNKADVDVKGQKKTVLVGKDGKTLYYFTKDTPAETACTGECASNWPPLVYTGSDNPTAAEGITGKLGVVKNAHGNHVVYNGHYLYYYAGDSAAGQTNGEGVGGNWYVATPDLPGK